MTAWKGKPECFRLLSSFPWVPAVLPPPVHALARRAWRLAIFAATEHLHSLQRPEPHAHVRLLRDARCIFVRQHQCLMWLEGRAGLRHELAQGRAGVPRGSENRTGTGLGLWLQDHTSHVLFPSARPENKHTRKPV